MRKIYLTNNGLVEILEGQDNLIKSDWVKVQLKSDGSPYAYYSQDGTPDLVKIQEEETKIKVEQDIANAKQYLLNTDYKVLPDYDGDTTGVLEARAEARVLINALEAELERL